MLIMRTLAHVRFMIIPEILLIKLREKHHCQMLK